MATKKSCATCETGQQKGKEHIDETEHCPHVSFDCHGHHCEKCHKCADWKGDPANADNRYGFYQKRNGGTCTFDGVDRDGDHDVHDFSDNLHHHCRTTICSCEDHK